MTDKYTRKFARYRSDAEFIIKIDSGQYKCKTIDYSDGIGILIDNDSLSLVPGNLVDVSIHSPEIELKGEVVWTKKVASGLRVGIKRVNVLNGSLSDFRLSDILIGIQRSTKTGILEVTRGPMFKRIYIKNGDMIFAVSNHEDDRIGEVLLKEGKIAQEQYNESVKESKKTEQELVKILIELGYIKPTDLPQAVRDQVESVILSLFTIEDSKFEFKEGPLPSEEAITLRLSAANLIYRGIKMINNLQYLKKGCPPMDAVLSLSPDPLNLFQDISLSDRDREILSFVDGRRSLKDILSLSSLSDFETLKTIHALLSIRIIVVKKKYDEHPELSPEEVITEREVEIDTKFVERLEKLYHNYETLGYHGVLGVDEFVSMEEIKRAYYRVAKEFHPDRHFSSPSEDMKEKLHAIFSYITEAYKTLSDSEKREEYNKSLSIKPKKENSNTEIAMERFHEGKSKIRKGNFSEASELLAQAVYLDDSVARYYYYHGYALRELGKHREAVEAINKALKLDPLNADCVAELGHIYLSLGFQTRATKTFEKALKLSPSNERALEGMGKKEVTNQRAAWR